jgi:uncharacterized protein (TIGR03000 family)
MSTKLLLFASVLLLASAGPVAAQRGGGGGRGAPAGGFHGPPAGAFHGAPYHGYYGHPYYRGYGYGYYPAVGVTLAFGGYGSGYGYGYGSGYGSGYVPGYVAPSSPAVVAEAGPYAPPPAGSAPEMLPPPTRDSAAGVHVLVPADATLWFNGVLTNLKGAERDFVTPELSGDRIYTYEVRARWTQDGRAVERTVQVEVRPNRTTTVDFTAPRG